MSSNNLNALLSDFYRKVGLADFVVNEDDYYCFTIDDSLLLELKYHPQSGVVDFFVQLGLIDPAKKDEILIEILDANVLWRGTGGVTLGQDSTTGMVTLAYQENVEHMSSTRFEQIIETVLISAEYWAGRVAGADRADTDPIVSSRGSAPDPLWIKS